MGSFKKRVMAASNGQGFLFIALPQLLLIIVLGGLVVLMIRVCTRSTKGSSSTTALKDQLLLLQRKLLLTSAINPEMERVEMEILQNKIKTTCDREIISGNEDLKQLFYSTCRSIQTQLRQPTLHERASWIRLNELMTGFNSSYFPG